MVLAATCFPGKWAWPLSVTVGGKGVSMVPGEMLMGEAEQLQKAFGHDDEFFAEARAGADDVELMVCSCERGCLPDA